MSSIGRLENHHDTARRTHLAAVLGLSAVVTAGPVMAGSFVIRDESLRGPDVSTALGQGYSLATHGFLGSCFGTIVASTPSYDFRYRFDAISETRAKSLTKTSRPDPFSVSTEGTVEKPPAPTTTTSATVANRLHIEVALEFQVYNRTLDESQSSLSPAARGLIERRDLLSFFDACGIYYVRTINRIGSYVSVLSYENPTGQRDPAFEADLEAMIKGWSGRGKKGEAEAAPPPVSRQVAREASKNRLTIQSVSVGFGKRAGKGSFIAQDLESFRAAILTAFEAIQSEDVGMVGSVEVVPWAENSQFGQSLGLEPTEITVTENGESRTVTRAPYQQRRILMSNAEFLAELGRATRARLELYEDSRKCHEDIQREYRELEEDGTTWRWALRGQDTWQKALVQNHRTKAWDRTLEQLWEIVNPEQIKRLQEDYHVFVYGAAEGTPAPAAFSGAEPTTSRFAGSNACVEELLSGETLLTRAYRDLPTCQRLEEFFTVTRSSLVTDYCRPKVG